MGSKDTVDDRGRKVAEDRADSDTKTESRNPRSLQGEAALHAAGDLETALASDLASIAEVRHVLTERADGHLLVWIVIDNAESYAVRSQVYDKELALIDGFPEVRFDFNLIPAMGRNPKELATGAQVLYTRS